MMWTKSLFALLWLFVVSSVLEGKPQDREHPSVVVMEQGCPDPGSPPPPGARIRFLVTVNDTWADTPGCMETVSTPLLAPGVCYKQMIKVGDCDHGPIWYTLLAQEIEVTFGSSVIVDAPHPSCKIPFSGHYLNPSKPGKMYNSSQGFQSPLPACYTEMSREGYHPTDYWFYVLEWLF